MLLRSLPVYTLKQLFFSISVNSGRIFTSPLRGSVNILPLFTEIEKNNCYILPSSNLFCCNVIIKSFQKYSVCLLEDITRNPGAVVQFGRDGYRQLINCFRVPLQYFWTNNSVINLGIRKSVIKEYPSIFHCTISTHHND